MKKGEMPAISAGAMGSSCLLLVGRSKGSDRRDQITLPQHDAIGHGPPMTPLLTDALCTSCGLCCDGTLFADVELTGPAEVSRMEIMGRDVGEENRSGGLLSQPCAALRGTRCGIYAHRPKCCRVFECHLLQNAQHGTVSVEAALEQIKDAREQIQHVRDL